MDRNAITANSIMYLLESLSARRAWIEIVAWLDYSEELLQVALRKESVDRNYTVPAVQENSKQSLSARRAWIEIPVRLST